MQNASVRQFGKTSRFGLLRFQELKQKVFILVEFFFVASSNLQPGILQIELVHVNVKHQIVFLQGKYPSF